MLIETIILLLQAIPLTGYLSGGTAFPQALTEEEEVKYVKLYSQGDQAARGELIEHNLRLVAHIAKKYGCATRDMDDLISIGTIGLIKAVNTYDLTSGKALGTYAAKCIENEILMSIRAERKKRFEVPMEEVIGADKNGNEVQLSALLGTPHDQVERIVELDMATKLASDAIERILTPRERLIIELRYGINRRYLTQKEIAAMLGISRSYVSRIEKKALSKLADEIGSKCR